MSDPRTGLVACVAVAVAASMVEGWVPLSFLAAGAVGCAVWRRPAAVGPALGIVAAILWSAAWTQGLFYADQPRTVAFWMGPWPIYMEGLAHGVEVALRQMAPLAAGMAWASRAGREGALVALVGLGVPSRLAMIVDICLRFLPTLAKEWSDVVALRRRRGAADPFGVLVPMAARALRRSTAVAEAMTARGIDPAGSMAQPEWRGRWVAALIGLATAGIVVAKLAAWSWAAGWWWHPVAVPAMRALRLVL